MLKQPASIVKMTNVAFIKYKINNKTFQVACYRNKAVNWRNGLEKDIGQVLQTDQIYENASHGTLAKKSDLNKYFPNKGKFDIIQIILEKGELQISDKQRDSQIANLTADIALIITEKCVHPLTNRHFTLQSIKAAMKQIHFPVKLDQPAKKQALQCIKLLLKRYKMIRAMMKIKLTFPKIESQSIEASLHQIEIQKHESQQIKQKQIERVYLIQPSKYREINTICKKLKNTSVEVLVNVVSNTDVKQLEQQSSALLQLLDQYKHQKAQQLPKQQIKKVVSKNDKESQCSSCKDASFLTKQDQRNHFKSAWHVENIKRKTKGLQSLSEEQYKIKIFDENYSK